MFAGLTIDALFQSYDTEYTSACNSPNHLAHPAYLSFSDGNVFHTSSSKNTSAG
jgi:hypothetical protein